MGFFKDRLHWCSPETVVQRARKLRPGRKSRGLLGYLELTSDERLGELGKTYATVLESGTEEPIPKKIRDKLIFLIDGALKVGDQFLADVLALNARAANSAESVMLHELGMRDIEDPKEALIEGLACTISFFENQKYALTELSEGYTEEKALIRWLKNKEELCDRLVRAIERGNQFQERFSSLE